MRVGSVIQQYVLRAARRIERRDARILDRSVDRHDREEDRLAVGQKLGPQVLAFAILAAGRGENGDVAAMCRYPQQSPDAASFVANTIVSSAPQAGPAVVH